MSEQSSINSALLEQLVHAIENLHTHIVELEAMASSAAAQLAHVPYMPRQQAADEHPRDVRNKLSAARLHWGRLHSLVHATAERAEAVLQESSALVAQADALFIHSGGNGSGEDNGSGSGSGNGSGSRGGNGMDQQGANELRSPAPESAPESGYEEDAPPRSISVAALG